MKVLKDKIFYLLILLATILACRELFRPGFFSIHDDLQAGRLYEMDLCFRDGQIPCRWVPDMGYSYGYPLFNYYPPFPYYLGELIHFFGFGYIDSTKVLFILGFLVSGLLMFAFARRLWGNWGGVLSSVLYLWAPYHAVDSYVRGAMNEFWALAFLPGIYWMVYALIEATDRRQERKYLLGLAFFSSLLLLSHNLMAFIFAPGIAIFALLLLWLKKTEFKEKFLKLIFGAVLGFGLAAFFTLPVLLEKKYVHVETMLMGYFNYLAHYVSINKMLFTRFWGYGSSGWLQETGMPFQVGLPHWPLAAATFLLFVFLYLRKKLEKKYLFLNIFFFALFLFSLFLVHPRSVVIWQKIPLLAYLQFPWRFLTLVIFAISVSGGGIVYLIKKKTVKVVASLVLMALVIALNFNFFKVEKTIQITDTEKLFSAKGWNKLQTDAIFDYLPIAAKAPPAGPAPESPLIVEGTAKINSFTKGTDWYKFQVSVEKEATLQIPIYFFPGWQAWIDGQRTSISHNNFLGLITITVPKGNHLIAGRLTDTPVRVAANAVSVVAGIIFIFLILKGLKFNILRK